MKSIAGRRRIVHIVIYTILVFLALSMAFPYYWMVVTTFKTPQEVYSGELRLFPSKFSIEVYKKVLSSKEIPILRFFCQQYVDQSRINGYIGRMFNSGGVFPFQIQSTGRFLFQSAHIVNHDDSWRSRHRGNLHGYQELQNDRHLSRCDSPPVGLCGDIYGSLHLYETNS